MRQKHPHSTMTEAQEIPLGSSFRVSCRQIKLVIMKNMLRTILSHRRVEMYDENGCCIILNQKVDSVSCFSMSYVLWYLGAIFFPNIKIYYFI